MIKKIITSYDCYNNKEDECYDDDVGIRFDDHHHLKNSKVEKTCKGKNSNNDDDNDDNTD